MEFVDNYSSYTVPSGTKLFRKAADRNFHDEMFFAFSIYGAYSSNISTKEFQIWETVTEISALLMIKGKNSGGRVMSSIVDIYNHYFPHDIKGENYYLEIKDNLISRRELVRILKSKGIINWVCSVENKTDMELFLFHSKDYNSGLIRYVESIYQVSDNLTDFDSFDRTILEYCNLIN